MREIKVYGTRSHRTEARQGHNQTREIVAARSKSEAIRIFKAWGAWIDNVSETGNQIELLIAKSAPGRVFWTELDSHWDAEWRMMSTEGRDPATNRDKLVSVPFMPDEATAKKIQEIITARKAELESYAKEAEAEREEEKKLIRLQEAAPAILDLLKKISAGEHDFSREEADAIANLIDYAEGRREKP